MELAAIRSFKIELMTMSHNLSEPVTRQKILKSIEPLDAKHNHGLLSQIFQVEMRDRSHRKTSDYDEDYHENLYWCGFLLFHVGDLRDVLMMWQAKQIDMDTNCGFDIQILVGAGVETTIKFLVENHHQEIANRLIFCQEQGDFDRLDEWQNFRQSYYYE